MEGLFRGTWYRSQHRLEGDIITPIPPFEPYNPFDWYYSAHDLRQGEKSLYLEFLEVDTEKPEEILKFCQRFGVLGSATEVIQHYLRIQEENREEKRNLLDDKRRKIADKDFAEMVGNPDAGGGITS